MVLVLTFRSVILFELISVFFFKLRVKVHFFPYENLNFLALLVKKTFLSPFFFVWVCFLALCPVFLRFLSILKIIPSYLSYDISCKYSLTLFCFVRIILTVIGPLCFYMHFKISLSISTGKENRIFDWNLIRIVFS